MKEDDSHQIVQIEDFYPIRYVQADKGVNVPDDLVNVVDLDKENKCEEERAMLSPKSLGLTKSEFDSLWSSLRKGSSEGKRFIFTYGECGVDGPLVGKVEVCTPAVCGQ